LVDNYGMELTIKDAVKWIRERRGLKQEDLAKKAGIGVDGRSRHLGLFVDEEEAALAYNKAAVERFGDFARINEIT
jgi:transcriptional regulator with XRE-family HTH domain